MKRYIKQNVISAFLVCFKLPVHPSMSLIITINTNEFILFFLRRTRRQDIRNGDPLSQCSDLQHHGTSTTNTYIPLYTLASSCHTHLIHPVCVCFLLSRRHGRIRRQCGGQECVRCGEQQHVPGVQPQVSESAHLLAAAEAQRRSQARGVYV